MARQLVTEQCRFMSSLRRHRQNRDSHHACRALAVPSRGIWGSPFRSQNAIAFESLSLGSCVNGLLVCTPAIRERLHLTSSGRPDKRCN